MLNISEFVFPLRAFAAYVYIKRRFPASNSENVIVLVVLLPKPVNIREMSSPRYVIHSHYRYHYIPYIVGIQLFLFFNFTERTMGILVAHNRFAVTKHTYDVYIRLVIEAPCLDVVTCILSA